MSLGVVLYPPESGNAVDGVVAHAREARDAGLRSVWWGQRFDYDGIGLAAVVGREVPDVRVGTSAVPIFERHPILVNAQAQTAQAATGGRFQLGLALGAPAIVEPAFGLKHERPALRLREFLTVLRSLADTGTVDFAGETITARAVRPVPLAGADPAPLLVAALGPHALRVAGELADGTLPFLAGPRTLGEHIVPAITAAAEAAGRPAPRVVAFLPGAVVPAAELDAARATAEEHFAFYDRIPSYQRVVALEGRERAAELVALGDEDALAAEIRRYFDAGATEVVVSQSDLAGDAARRRTFALLGELAG
ncbi:Pyrimidine monooxygenase RutA [Actinomadura rubteroloni]|uniref:Pyrimidine monooxygenase RutA n=1 Tax=Actinomadura rubteroloni TaxID=1926885 RepID=A0A2P4UJM8_9ACTN|nr:TIGR03564 family F420-dependent LLM class oxidoreductase [Actinomadura rubteroloni]POM25254.1 Pyrimidine monooxygenase RutA [Actinomadura rubteroloni]